MSTWIAKYYRLLALLAVFIGGPSVAWIFGLTALFYYTGAWLWSCAALAFIVLAVLSVREFALSLRFSFRLIKAGAMLNGKTLPANILDVIAFVCEDMFNPNIGGAMVKATGINVFRTRRAEKQYKIDMEKEHELPG
jgi:hypothetical protein